MILKSMTLRNFKAIGDDPVMIEFKPITLLFGPNSAGKSTIIQALHYAREVFVNGNLDPDITESGGESVNLGGLRRLLHRRDEKRAISIRFDFSLEQGELPRFTPDQEADRLESDFPDSFRLAGDLDTAYIAAELAAGPYPGWYLGESLEVGFSGIRFAIIEDLSVQMELSDTLQKVALPVVSKLTFALDHPCFAVGPGNALRELCGPILFGKQLEAGQAVLRISGETLPQWDQPLQTAGHKLAPLSTTDESLEGGGRSQLGDDAYLRKDALEELLSRLVVGPARLLAEVLEHGFDYLGPLRAVPRRDYRPRLTRNISDRATGLTAWDRFFERDDWNDEEVFREINEWLVSRMDTGYRLEAREYFEMPSDLYYLLKNKGVVSALFGPDKMLKNIQEEMGDWEVSSRLAIIDERTGLRLEPFDVGIGISQLVPVIVASVFTKEGILAIEQPELHVHPAVQTALGDLFAPQVSGKPDLRFLIETHSEHLMLRLLRRIRETGSATLPEGAPPLRKEDVAVLYVERAPDGMKVTTLRIDETGEFIDRWPQGFFEEREEELF